MSTVDMDAPTHAVIEATDEMPAERLGKFNGALFPLDNGRFTALTGMVLVIEDLAYRAHPTGARKEVNATRCIVYHVNPVPDRVEM